MTLEGKTCLGSSGTGSFGRTSAQAILRECNPNTVRKYNNVQHR